MVTYVSLTHKQPISPSACFLISGELTDKSHMFSCVMGLVQNRECYNGNSVVGFVCKDSTFKFIHFSLLIPTV